MARRHRRKSSKKHSNAPRRARRSHRKSHRRSARSSMFRNAPSQWKDLTTAVIWGGAGYLAAQWGGKYVTNMLPAMVPQRDIVGPALTSAAVIFAADWGLKSNPSARVAAQTGGAIPLVNAIINKAGWGNRLGTAPVIMIPAPSGSGSTPLSAALAAALSGDINMGASLSGDINMGESYTSDY